MSIFEQISTDSISGNVFERIGKQWMLITAGSEAGFNTMTASWGGLGVLWNYDVAYCFIRPQRYTLPFVEREPRFTLSFFSEEYRKALNICGTKSGRDIDKIKATGLTPIFADDSVYFEEAKLVLVCDKLYKQDIDPKGFIIPSIEKNYEIHDYHRMFIGGIVKAIEHRK